MDRPGHRPSDPTERLARLTDAAAEALEDGRAEEALARAEEALALGPRSVPALHLRGDALADLGRIAEAREAFERALGPGKDDPELLAGAADFLVNRLPDDEAEEIDLERGLELARRGSRRARRTGDPALAADLALLEGQALGKLGRPDEALARLAAAARDAPDRADVRLEQGIALYELCRFEEAQAALLQAERLDPEEPWVEHYLGLVAERQGRADEARRRLDRARRRAPDEFPRPVALSPAAFDAAVEDALAELPEDVRRYLSNVAISVEDLPSDDDLGASDPPLSPAILGRFRGAPYGQKASMDPWSHLPSSIVLYQVNLERFARSRAELIEQIRVTLVHEVGHFLGLDEDELYTRGLE